jgi:riboflavin synthase
MFTGIIEQKGIIKDVIINGTNRSFHVESPLSHELKVDQSVSHDGVCLTVEQVTSNMHIVTAIEETLKKTNLSTWKIGTIVNLERCLQFNGRIDGHIVQGHVDTTATCNKLIEKDGSWEYSFQFDKKFASLIIEKGSITINGTSLTCFNINENEFTVAIIPYTYHHTNISYLKVGSIVNIEFDMIGKYVNRIQQVS